MSQFTPDQPPWVSSAAPPTQPYIPERKASSWPLVFGVIAIVFGGMGVLAYGLGAVANALMPSLPGIGGADAPAMFRGIREWQGWLIGVSLAAAALSSVLLIGGIAMLGRRRWAVTMLLVWAVAKLLFVPAQTVINYKAQWVQMQAMSEDIKSGFENQMKQSGQTVPFAPAVFDQFFQLGMIVGVIFGLLWGWALPIVILIWFGRRRIRTEVGAWG